MSSGYYEYRLQQIDQLLLVLGDKMNKVEREELEDERNKILHELRYTESLPTNIN